MCGVDPDNELDAESMAALAPALGKLVSLTSLNLTCTCVCVVGLCSGGVLAWQFNSVCVCGVVAGMWHGGNGVAVLAPSLGKLVSLTSLDLSRT